MNLRALAAALCLIPALAAANDQAAQVFGTASPSVYSVLAWGKNGEQMLGSAVVVGQSRLATNHHVIANAERIVVRHGDEQHEAIVESSDAGHDLALLQAPGISGPPATLSDSTRLRIGETVYAIGSPRGLELSLSEGIVSSLRQTADGAAIQTTAPISPGSSGGGLFDAQGRLLGLTTAQVVNGQNLNFAVPVEWLRFVGLRTQTLAAATAPAPAQAVAPAALDGAIAPVPAPASTPLATARPAVHAPEKVTRAPSLYVATALILLLLVGAKPAADWLSDFLSRDPPLPSPPRVPRTSAPVSAADKRAPFLAQAREEIKRGERDADLWRRALETSSGDEPRAIVAYIELRAHALQRADMDRRWEQARQTSAHAGAGRDSHS